ncbi:hypothetical protein [Cryobacterium fucosi]|uniref:Uncharacterized protein n=1 Tax=Cryobacterium fucosi TaxID=1259157 RepID=A0A4R9B339_9MICO|nr:hypothetical protein [Cryobacterium fucosi]TFD74719.1 hypothetical protein E3T48_12400 [Cryobacterium fucosi]
MRDFPGAVWSRFPFTRKQRLSIAFWARNRYGRPYNYAAFVAIGVALMLKRSTPEWVERFLMTDRSYECAQLADAALMHAGVHVFRDGRPYGAVYPGSFVKVWEHFGWWPDGPA